MFLFRCKRLQQAKTSGEIRIDPRFPPPLMILAHKIARAVYFILKRKTVYQPEIFFA